MGNKAGFNDDQLFDIASVCLDNKQASPPATPPSDQTEVYVKDKKVYKKDDAGLEIKIGPQDANVTEYINTTVNTAVGDTLQDFINKACAPTNSQKATYLGNGEVDYVEIFSGPSQITANRVARVDMAYDGSLNPTTETWVHYDPADGSTVLKTHTKTHSWVGADYDKTTSVTS
jgi:hypothetical protein